MCESDYSQDVPQRWAAYAHSWRAASALTGCRQSPLLKNPKPEQRIQPNLHWTTDNSTVTRSVNPDVTGSTSIDDHKVFTWHNVNEYLILSKLFRLVLASMPYISMIPKRLHNKSWRENSALNNSLRPNLYVISLIKKVYILALHYI